MLEIFLKLYDLWHSNEVLRSRELVTVFQTRFFAENRKNGLQQFPILLISDSAAVDDNADKVLQGFPRHFLLVDLQHATGHVKGCDQV